MPLFGPPPHPTQKAPPEVNRFWRRMMWDHELNRLYSHLDQVTHSVDVHQKKLYLENTFHDQARDRATQLYADKISRENIGMFKRLMAVHTRKPREFLTHHVQNPKTHSRFLEYQRVMQDNHRLVDRLLRARTFVNERGTWDEHAQEHEEILLRLSHNPKNCFIPNLKQKRKKDQQIMKELSVSRQARQAITEKTRNIHTGMKEDFERIERLKEQNPNLIIPKDYQGESTVIREKSPRYKYPLPPATSDGADESDGTQGLHPTVLLPYGTHLVAPALLNQEQYAALTERLKGLELHAPGTAGSSGRPRSYATTGDLSDSMLTMPMPPADAQGDGSDTTGTLEEQKQQQDVFYLHPHRPGSTSQQHQSTTDAEYPFKFPPLEGRDGVRLREDPSTVAPNASSSSSSNAAPPPVHHRRGKSSGLHLNGSSEDSQEHLRAATAYPSARQHGHARGPSNAFLPTPPSAPHHQTQSSLSSTQSQKFLAYFHEESTRLLGESPVQPPERTQYVSGRVAQRVGLGSRPKPHVTQKVMSTSYAAPGVPPSSQQQQQASSSSLTAGGKHHWHYHHDLPSVFAHSTSASSSSGPRGSPQSRRTQQRALEQLLDQLLLSAEDGEDGQPEEEDVEYDEHAEAQPQSYAQTQRAPRRANPTRASSMQSRPPQTARPGSNNATTKKQPEEEKQPEPTTEAVPVEETAPVAAVAQL